MRWRTILARNERYVVLLIKDVECVRTQHHICGLLSGTLPLIPQQNVFLGLPLRLLNEEVVFLLRKEAAILIDESRAYIEPTTQQRTAFHDHELDDIYKQKQRTLVQQEEHRKRIEAQLKASDGDGALERRRARQAAKGEASNDAQVAPTLQTSEDVLERMPYVHYTRGESTLIPGYVPCTHAMLPNMPRGTQVNAYTTLKDAFVAGVWAFPATLEDRARCAVFEDLHEKGYFLSTGLRFGGDFVVYPGDPLRYHSHYTATVLATPAQSIPAFHIIASGRLGTAVKKSHLICQANTSVRDDTQAQDRRRRGDDDSLRKTWGQVQYWSLTWAGFGT